MEIRFGPRGKEDVCRVEGGGWRAPPSPRIKGPIETLVIGGRLGGVCAWMDRWILGV